MESSTNFAKARHDVYEFRLFLQEYTRGFNFKRMSPSVRQFVFQIIDVCNAIADVLGDEHDLQVEINVWEQLSMTFPLFEVDEDGKPSQVE